ncbi:hypothetical protein BIW11_11429 [Tropilaelaps mercedesae]|uniref:Chitin-binding type-2 domain-containing protein n=1 Tax=Tropilaelaps mercedesae TaxID=418985 RepID=A0A1V9XB28_9ACAR|nr:hypothetical protein BIW11_11429 [Tropilaelaps mercedesae]
MKSFIVLSVVAAAALGASHRTRRAAFQFADGVDDVVGEVRTTFQCPERYGYFADVDNDCKVFHICNPIRNSEGEHRISLALQSQQHNRSSVTLGIQTHTCKYMHPQSAASAWTGPLFSSRELSRGAPNVLLGGCARLGVDDRISADPLAVQFGFIYACGHGQEGGKGVRHADVGAFCMWTSRERAIEQVDHYSFFCGNQTVFNQLTLTCAHPEEAVPCPNAPDFFYVNDNIGKEEAAFLTDADVQRGAALYPGYAQPTPDAAPAQAAATNQYYYTVPHPKAQQMYSAYDNYPTYPVHPTTSRRDQQVYVSGPQDSHRPEISRRASAAFGQRIRK